MAEGTRIVLIRHGESRAQELGIVAGHAGCQGLSERGRAQAQALHDRLAHSGELSDASVFYASLMPRAIETAQIIAPAIGDLELRLECGFCEGHPGDADGLTWVECDERYPAGEWTADRARAPGWETWTEMGVRVAKALTGLVKHHPGETIVVACHGGVVAQSMMHFLALHELATTPRAWISPDNTSITEWCFASNPYHGETMPLELVRYNDFAHLSRRPRG